MNSKDFAAQFVLALRDYANLHPDQFDVPMPLYKWMYHSAQWLDQDGVTRKSPNVPKL